MKIEIPHLETDITTACQLSCVACNHHVPLWREHGVTRADVEQVGRDMEALSKVLHTRVWGALGGEPLLHTELDRIIYQVRRSGIADEIEVWTNGILVPKMTDRFWTSQFDTLVVSVYEGKHTEESIRAIEGLCGKWQKRLVVKDERTWHNFRTLLEPTPTGPAETKAKYAGCFFRSFSRVVNDGYFYTCCCAPHMPVLLQGRPKGSDGIPVEGITVQKLRAYLESREPLGACSMCAGRDTAVPIRWREERDPDKWVAASKGVPSEC